MALISRLTAPERSKSKFYQPNEHPMINATCFSSVWFKIDEAGKNDQGEWAATDGLYATNSVYSVTIPEALRPGQYIVRHEIIALHQYALLFSPKGKLFRKTD